ncbi:MAG: hypothetical protein SPL00_04605 [Bacilli bacterium]|nr:hypothetical protein [Bacilli bacterium]
MIYMVIAGFSLIFSMNMFYTNFCYMGTYRAYLGLYKGAIEVGVITFDNEGREIVPYFNKLRVVSSVTSYYRLNLKKYVLSYSISYQWTKLTVVFGDEYYRGVIITLDTSIYGVGEKKFYSSFSIEESGVIVDGQ